MIRYNEDLIIHTSGNSNNQGHVYISLDNVNYVLLGIINSSVNIHKPGLQNCLLP